MSLHTEINFENEIGHYLADHGWLYSPSDDGYDRARALFPEDVIAWVQATQPTEWAAIEKNHGAAAPATLLVDIDIDGLFASHDFTGMTAGAFVTVVGKQQDQWAFNYDTYIGDEVTRWLPVSSPVATIPEPETALLAACGLLLCVVLRR